MRSHSVTCHPAEVTFPLLPQPKLVLDLSTPEGYKAELYSLPPLCAYYDCLLGSLTTVVLSLMLMQYITPDMLILGLRRVVGQTAVMAVSDARVEGYKH